MTDDSAAGRTQTETASLRIRLRVPRNGTAFPYADPAADAVDVDHARLREREPRAF